MEPLLKQRLIGAITLVVLGVMIIPVILNGPPEGRRPTVINQPVFESATPQSVYKPPPAPVTVRVDSGGNTVADPIQTVGISQKPHSAPKKTGTTKKPGHVKGQDQDQHVIAPKSLLLKTPIDRYSNIDDEAPPGASRKTGKPSTIQQTGQTGPSVVKGSGASAARKPDPKSKRQRYVIQMGIFGEQSNASKLRGRLEKRGYRVIVEKEFSGSDSVYRVYVGPYPHRQAADASRKALVRRAKLRGFLKNYP